MAPHAEAIPDQTGHGLATNGSFMNGYSVMGGSAADAAHVQGPFTNSHATGESAADALSMNGDPRNGSAVNGPATGVVDSHALPLHDTPEVEPANTGYLPAEHVKAVKPNILFIMTDQMAPQVLKMHDPDSVVKTPNIDALAQSGVVFDSAYCPSPLCAPSRFCLVSGQLPSKIRAYDNASLFGSDVPTFAHYLRNEGYSTALAGKMHFIGPDQLHGFEERLTPDIYPGDFGWAVNWDKPGERLEWYHNMSSVLQAGPCVRSNQLDFDEETIFKFSSVLPVIFSQQWLYDYSRDSPEETRPFCLTVSMTHPHDPYAITEDLWDLYEDVDIPMPKVNIPQGEQDTHSKRLMKCIDLWDNPLPEEAIRRARRAYYAACTYVDNQVGKLMDTLRKCKLDKNTIVVFSGDHGDMLGERGLWYKMSWFEMSARVPLIINYPPLFNPHRVKESVSTMDLPLTLYELVGGRLTDIPIAVDGKSLVPALHGNPAHDEVFGEYMGEGTISSVMMIRRGRYKFVTSMVDEPQLFDLQEDPAELKNLAESEDMGFKKLVQKFVMEAANKWNLPTIDEDVRKLQRQRRFVWSALKQGEFTSWDYEPPSKGKKQYIRSNLPLDDMERRARYPPVDAMGRIMITPKPHGIAGAHNE
ncbi:alkaline-phosphatase-like protein [Lineolata rhizophorae]|uniref:Alkaline-phosphatase-like protein n=1 Tax=Lineolata rhizophorae TaxID=578093 RepID=A0A6A6P062_9PEZI|nr:alkaline-phosphatase-like protein [Lineolata rhizophorae]